MSMLFNRKVIIPVWPPVVFGLFALLGSPLTFATGGLVLLAAIAPPAIMLILWKAPSLTLSEAIAEELHPAERSRAK